MRPSTRQPARRPAVRGAVATVAVLLAGAGLAACGEDDDAATTTSTTTTSEATTSSTEVTTPAEQTEPVAVFFVRDEKVAVASADVDAAEPARGALEALLAGTGGVDGAEDMTTAVPEGAELLDVAIDGGTATVDLSAEFVSGGGSLSMQLRAAQVVFTLTQFDTVEDVTFLIDGATVDGLGGEGIPADQVDRAEFADVTPLVLVTSPLPGAEASSPLSVEGISNTFEATVLYELLGPDGEVLDDGFTTATAGSGTWGEFSFEVAFDDGVTGEGTLVAYQEDMESGGRQDVVEVPLTFGG